MLSGIGPADDLTRLKIPVVADLPGVGQNLQDHVYAPLVYSAARPVPEAFPGVAQFHVHMFWSSRPGLIGPNMQSLFGHLPHYPEGAAGPEDGYTFTSMLNRPAARGTVSLASADFRVAPVIDPRHGTCQADIDAICSGLQMLREIGEQPGLAAWRGEELHPGPSVRSLDDLRVYVRQILGTISPPIGTCKMGIDEMAVVDPKLKVHGVSGLRVVDASVMPTLIGGNTNAPSIMIGEKAADLIRNELRMN
jgi:choline dehydrogenase